MKILSIDQSLTNCAWVLWDNGEMIDFGVIQTSKDEEDHIRIWMIGQQIGDILSDNSVDLMVLEGLSFGSISTSVRKLAGLYYYLLIKTFKYEIPWQEVTPKSVKKFACHGKAKKKEMFEALPEEVQNQFSSKFKTIKAGKYDLADAYFIGQFCIENLKGK